MEADLSTHREKERMNEIDRNATVLCEFKGPHDPEKEGETIPRPTSSATFQPSPHVVPRGFAASITTRLTSFAFTGLDS